MSVRLRPLREDEYAAFLELGHKQYADDLHHNGSMTPEAAAAKAARDFAEPLPEGLATPGQTIAAIEEVETGGRVGQLWFAKRELGGRTVAYLYDITIDEPHRGRGVGRAAMLAFEQAAAADGRRPRAERVRRQHPRPRPQPFAGLRRDRLTCRSSSPQTSNSAVTTPVTVSNTHEAEFALLSPLCDVSPARLSCVASACGSVVSGSCERVRRAAG